MATCFDKAGKQVPCYSPTGQTNKSAVSNKPLDRTAYDIKNVKKDKPRYGKGGVLNQHD